MEEVWPVKRIARPGKRTCVATGRTNSFERDERGIRPPLCLVVRFIRSNGQMEVFGERSPVPPEAIHAHVRGTIDVRGQTLSLYLGAGLLG